MTTCKNKCQGKIKNCIHYIYKEAKKKKKEENSNKDRKFNVQIETPEKNTGLIASKADWISDEFFPFLD